MLFLQSIKRSLSGILSFSTTLLKNKPFCTHSSVVGIASTSLLPRLVTPFLVLAKAMHSLRCFCLKLALTCCCFWKLSLTHVQFLSYLRVRRIAVEPSTPVLNMRFILAEALSAFASQILAKAPMLASLPRMHVGKLPEALHVFRPIVYTCV